MLCFVATFVQSPLVYHRLPGSPNHTGLWLASDGLRGQPQCMNRRCSDDLRGRLYYVVRCSRLSPIPRLNLAKLYDVLVWSLPDFPDALCTLCLQVA